MNLILFLGLIATFFAADYDFIKELKGEWEVHVDETEVENDEDSVKFTGFLNLTYSIESVSMVSGKLKIENEDEELVVYRVSAESESEFIGSLSLAPLVDVEDDDVEMDIEDFTEDEEKEEDAIEVPLKFEPNQLSFHESNSLYTVGDKEGGIAIFTIISANAWTLTLVDKKNKVTKYTAKRVNIPQSSWLVRFGPMIMMFAVLVVPRLLGSAFKAPEVPTGPQETLQDNRPKTE